MVPVFPLFLTPRGVFKLHLVAFGPFSIDGLLSDKAMPPAAGVFMDPVHSAFINSAPLIVMVRNDAVIGATGMRKKVTNIHINQL